MFTHDYIFSAQQVVRFNSCDIRHIVTTGDRKTMFWGWEDGGLRGYIPHMSRHDFKKVRSPTYPTTL